MLCTELNWMRCCISLHDAVHEPPQTSSSWQGPHLEAALMKYSLQTYFLTCCIAEYQQAQSHDNQAASHLLIVVLQHWFVVVGFRDSSKYIGASEAQY
jgi:hypothetical protein